jgi:hypothetical protein
MEGDSVSLPGRFASGETATDTSLTLGWIGSNARLDSIGFEVFTAVVMKRVIFWDITPCSPLSVNRRFGGTSPQSSGSKK